MSPQTNQESSGVLNNFQMHLKVPRFQYRAIFSIYVHKLQRKDGLNSITQTVAIHFEIQEILYVNINKDEATLTRNLFPQVLT